MSSKTVTWEAGAGELATVYLPFDARRVRRKNQSGLTTSSFKIHQRVSRDDLHRYVRIASFGQALTNGDLVIAGSVVIVGAR